jgi:hypothetical protein
MARRKSTAVAQVGLRIREPLRAGLEGVAKKRGVSLNTEMVERLARTLAEDETYGGPEIHTMARLMAAAFLQGGRVGAMQRQHPEWGPAQWMSDPWCYATAVGTVLDTLEAHRPGRRSEQSTTTGDQARPPDLYRKMARMLARGFDVKAASDGAPEA